MESKKINILLVDDNRKFLESAAERAKAHRVVFSNPPRVHRSGGTLTGRMRASRR